MKDCIVANEATPCHGAVGAEGVQWDRKGWNVKNVPNANDMSVKQYLDGANTCDGSPVVVSQGNVLGREGFCTK